MTTEAELGLADDDRVAAAVLLVALGAGRPLDRVRRAAGFGRRFGMAADRAMTAKAGRVGHPGKRRLVAGGAIRREKPVRIR